MAVFEQQGAKGPSLYKCYKYLKSISPTSVESERCFSASGNIVTKYSMNFDTFYAISFLRSHFINTDTEEQQKKWFLVVVVEKNTLNKFENEKSSFFISIESIESLESLEPQYRSGLESVDTEKSVSIDSSSFFRLLFLSSMCRCVLSV
jgi:CMP-2-keto-3-deoxyoctulosonic acid synthetase